MLESRRQSILSKAILLIAVGLLVRHAWNDFLGSREVVSARSFSPPEKGEFGGDLDFLRQHWTVPRTEGESNHYIDLWSNGTLAALARVNGLTNNRALFVDSHGRTRISSRSARARYALHPHQSLVQPHTEMPFYSFKDLAQMLGCDQAAQIHNIVIAGCNEERSLRSQDLRLHFVNATNISYMTPGQLAFKPMYYQAIVLPSTSIKTLYGRLRRTSGSRMEAETFDTPERGTKPLGVYIADLYLPEARLPFRTRKAGRELLEPTSQNKVMLRADAPFTAPE